jgi:hypothetical protein
MAPDDTRHEKRLDSAEQPDHTDLYNSLLSMAKGGLKSTAAKLVLEPLLRANPSTVRQIIENELGKRVSDYPNSVVDIDVMGACISQTDTNLALELWNTLKVGPTLISPPNNNYHTPLDFEAYFSSRAENSDSNKSITLLQTTTHLPGS